LFFSEHQRVLVQGGAGRLESVEIVFGAVRHGAALTFCPEVNAIFKARTDQKCGIPAFERVPILKKLPRLLVQIFEQLRIFSRTNPF
jgi:hypothetical protein